MVSWRKALRVLERGSQRKNAVESGHNPLVEEVIAFRQQAEGSYKGVRS